MFIKVITLELATQKTHDERTVNLKNVAGQRWLINHFNWAFRNGMGVQMLSVEDAEPCAS